MLHRLTALAIVVFWFVMTLLLVRNELNPESSRVREVPVAHVLKLLYLHEQASDLIMWQGAQPVGSLRLQPRLDHDGTARLVEISGDLRLPLNAQSRGRFSWVGLVTLTRNNEFKHAKWSFNLIEPSYLRVDYEQPGSGQAGHYTLRNREGVLSEGDFAPGQAALTGLAKQFGYGAELEALAGQQLAQPPTIHARQSSLRYHGEMTETYLVTLEQNGQTLIEAHVSQLGQVLQAKTLIGYTLRPEDLVP